jgi:chemotaxis protein MotA
MIVARSFLGTPDQKILASIRQLDDAIINDLKITDLREGSEINGELLNDIVYMTHQGLLFEEIDEFVTSRISDDFLARRIAVEMMNRAAVISPALGLFGTVIGLIGVLKSLSDPGQIGPSMSLALMTTAYGAGLGSIVFTPLSGRLEHHNTIFIEVHKQLMSKVGILLSREERSLITEPLQHVG